LDSRDEQSAYDDDYRQGENLKKNKIEKFKIIF
jgi:hypothetical protein